MSPEALVDGERFIFQHRSLDFELPNAVLLGAAELAFQTLLDDPRRVIAEVDGRYAATPLSRH